MSLLETARQSVASSARCGVAGVLGDAARVVTRGGRRGGAGGRRGGASRPGGAAASRGAAGRRGVHDVGRRALALALLLLLTVPAVRADATINVAAQEVNDWVAPDVFPQRYRFNLVDPPFNATNPLAGLGVSFEHEWGVIDPGFRFGFNGQELRETIVTYYISNATTTREVRLETRVSVGCSFFSCNNLEIDQDIYLDGGFQWHSYARVDPGIRFVGGPGFVDHSSFIGWLNGNLTAFTHEDAEANETWNGIAGGAAFSGGTIVVAWLGADERWFEGAGNGTTSLGRDDAQLFFLANMSGVDRIEAVATYPRGDAPNALVLRHQFLTAQGREAKGAFSEDEPCPGLKAAVKKIFGVCPSLAGLVGFMAGGAAGVTERLVGAVPGLDGVSSGVGVVAGLVIGVYVYGLGLILLEPVKLLIVLEGHIVFYSLLFAGYQREPRALFQMIGTGNRVVGKGVMYYVLGTLWLVKYVLELLSKLVHVIVQAVRG